MDNPQAEARLFLYDLANLAKEHWFKPGENWTLRLVNETEKTALEKQYRPTLYIQGETAALQEISGIVCTELHLAALVPEAADERHARKAPATYLLAYNPARQKL